VILRNYYCSQCSPVTVQTEPRISLNVNQSRCPVYCAYTPPMPSYQFPNPKHNIRDVLSLPIYLVRLATRDLQFQESWASVIFWIWKECFYGNINFLRFILADTFIMSDKLILKMTKMILRRTRNRDFFGGEVQVEYPYNLKEILITYFSHD
jgi:hypothetical protein